MKKVDLQTANDNIHMVTLLATITCDLEILIWHGAPHWPTIISNVCTIPWHVVYCSCGTASLWSGEQCRSPWPCCPPPTPSCPSSTRSPSSPMTTTPRWHTTPSSPWASSAQVGSGKVVWVYKNDHYSLGCQVNVQRVVQTSSFPYIITLCCGHLCKSSAAFLICSAFYGDVNVYLRTTWNTL